MLLLFSLQFSAFPEKKNPLLKWHRDILNIEASGSLGVYFGGKCHQTLPNETIHFDEKLDWCSNIGSSASNMPWITYEMRGKAMRLNGYSVRNGCCWYDCCCVDDNTIYDYMCCCRLYSFSLLGSNDNVTWTIIHKVENETKFYECQHKTYDFPLTESFKYIKFKLDRERPGCPKCMQINQIELYGELIDSLFSSYESDDGDESVSIIGKVKRFNHD